MRRQAVLISRKYEMYLPSQSTVPPATDCWLSKRPIVSKEIRPSRPLPYGGTLMAQFAQRRFLPENAMSYGHWFSTSHSSTMCRRLITEKSYRWPARASSQAARPPPSKAIESQTWPAHVRQRDVRIPRQNGTEVLVRFGGRGEGAEVIRFCGLALALLEAQYREYGRPATSRATGAFSPGFLGERGARLTLELARWFNQGKSNNPGFAVVGGAEADPSVRVVKS